MTASHSSGKDPSRDGSLERFNYFKKDDFENDWDKVAERKFCRVYKVKLKLWRETCALKTTTSDYRNMINMSKIGKVKFNYLISIYGISKDPPALVMEYMSKGSLDNILNSHVLMWPKKFQMIHEVTMGMNFLHSLKPPILHLNLKPANILLDDHLHVKISDFGLIKWEEFSSKTEFVEHLTARGNIHYIPPETFTQNPEPPGTKYDVYSFSIVMWEILSQQRSYQGLSMTEILIRVSSGKRPSVEKIPEDKPPESHEMIGVMKQSWHQDCNQRPAFSETILLTEVLSNVLKIPDTKLRGKIRSLNKQERTSNTTADTSDDSSTSIYSLLKKKDFETFKKNLRKEHVSMLFKDNNSLLHHAVASGDKESVQIVLDLGASVNCQSVKGYTPLIIAVLNKFYEICSLLTDCGADVNLSDGDQWTALHFATQAGDDRATRLLLDNKVRADAKEKDGWTPLHLAAQNGHENIVRILLPRLDSVDEQECQSGRTALHVACVYGHVNIVKLLLKQGADVNKTDNLQSTSLHLAADEGHFRVVRLLVNSNADVKIVNERSYSPLHFAAIKGCTGICRILLSKGVDPDSKTNQNWTAMHLASLKGHPEIIHVLEEHHGSVNIQGKDGWTPLHLACHHGQEEVVSVLLAAGADPNLAEDNGWTPLHLACNSSCFASVLQLISHQANVNALNNHQSTPLHLAAQHSNIPIIKALLMNNAQRGMLDSKGCTALTLAQRCNNTEAVQLLDS
ncbi:ankyrin repeat and protein kinase domain-containing protein 1-like [Myxocyprinus asiaticus]|uniref:ankyrin repeat and protein kinase domain-containing protein 1-like n=1 Tax=Myxocyprinus asiaticus TaxID=70543 RepID=UPI002222CCBC|nr:ankyrin repeat and protein kinase domain-containing protein 1-like [Myxocyprinus asiaticus]